MADDKVFTVDNIPADVEVFTGKGIEYKPIDPGEIYQVVCEKVELRLNKFYKPDEKDPMLKGSKYQLNFQYMILNEGEFQLRKLWDTTSLSLKPTTKQGKGGPTKLYKIVSRCLKQELTWDDCASFAPDAKKLLENLEDVVVGNQLRVTVESITNPETLKVRSKIVNYTIAKDKLPIPEKEETPPPPTDDLPFD